MRTAELLAAVNECIELLRGSEVIEAWSPSPGCIYLRIRRLGVVAVVRICSEVNGLSCRVSGSQKRF